MKTIFQLCQPRDDVLHGELHEDIFAADLQDVTLGKADPIYQDPQRFFENTYPTTGLRALLHEALGRLSGARPDANPVLRLETSFGGGKTHNLIALYHAARGNLPANLAERFLSTEYLPSPGSVRVAVLDGNALDPNGVKHPDGIVTYTPWGELAYQLAGPEGYALAEESDRARVAPGRGLWDTLIGNTPTVILIDEIARFLRTAQGIKVEKSTLADQVAPFLMALLKFATARPQCVVVLTLAGEEDAFATETSILRQELQRISARQEQVLVPADEDELPAIVTHRLFTRVDREGAEPIFEAYLAAYRAWHEQQVPLPQAVLRADYHEAMWRTYPFHPAFLYTLSHKTATIPAFQRTRGALRLLARIVRDLWQDTSKPVYLIHPHHMNLANPRIVADLTSRLERPKFQQVIEADIVSNTGRAHAQQADRIWEHSGKPPYTQRVAKAVFLHSLVQGGTSGVTPADLYLAVLEPHDDPLLIRQALERLEETAWFFEFDGHRYRFKTEPSLNKIILDEMGAIGRLKAKEHLDQRIRSMWPSGTVKVRYFPREPGEVPENAEQPQLVILHYDAVQVSATEAQEPPDMVRRIFKFTGSLEANRTYANYLAFLVADADQVEAMVQQAQRELAIARLLEDNDRLSEFTKEQRTRLRKMREAAKLEVAVAIARCYRHLYFPSAEAPASADRLLHVVLPAQDQGDVQKDQVAVVLRVLREQGKALTHDDPPKSAHYLKARAWPQGRERISTGDLRRAFAQSLRLPWLLDPNQLRRSIRNGIEQGVWVYYDTRLQQAYDRNSPPPHIEIGEDTYLYTLEAATRESILKREESSSLEPESTPSDSASAGEIPTFDYLKPTLTTESLPLRQAFMRLLDQAHDIGVQRFRVLRLHLIRESGKDVAAALRSLAAALPLLPRGEKVVTVACSLTLKEGRDLSVEGALDEQHFRAVVQFLAGISPQAEDATLDLALVLKPETPVDKEAVNSLMDTLATLALGDIALTGEPEEETA